MDTQALVDRLKAALDELRRERGTIQLAMLIGSDLSKDTWNFVISAPWLDAMSQKDAVDGVISWLKSKAPDTLDSFSRVSPTTTNDPFVRSVGRMIRMPGGGDGVVHLDHCSFDGTEVDRAIVLVSEKPITHKVQISLSPDNSLEFQAEAVLFMPLQRHIIHYSTGMPRVPDAAIPTGPDWRLKITVERTHINKVADFLKGSSGAPLTIKVDLPPTYRPWTVVQMTRCRDVKFDRRVLLAKDPDLTDPHATYMYKP